MKFLKLDQKGISHYIVPAVFVIIIGVIGIRVLTVSHADTSMGIIEHTANKPKGLPQINQQTGTFQTYGNTSSGICNLGTCFYYAAMAENTKATGASVTLSQPQPKLGSKDIHSLAELAVESADGKQIVEIGWTVDPGVNSDSSPHLFVYHWVNGQSTCYNGCGFISTSKADHAGGAVKVGVGGTYAIQYKNNQWQLIYNGVQIGYFPGYIWNGLFDHFGLVQVFGEVASSSQTPQAQMGNGVLGTSPGSAVIRNLTLTGASTTNTLSYNAIGAPAKYNVGAYDARCITACGMNFGGPGY